MQQLKYIHQEGQIEGNFECALEGKNYHYLATYEGGRSVEWRATVRRGSCFSWSSGTLPHNQRTGVSLAEAVRAQVLASIGVMRMC